MSHFIDGQWMSGQGPELISLSPADGSVVWQGLAADAQQVDRAFEAARRALGPWAKSSGEVRMDFCRRFADYVQAHSAELADLISREMGKTRWEARGEVATVVGKIALSIEALANRRDTQRFELSGYQAVTRFKPYGVMAVLGPFNFPAHLPNGHIVPALLAGNTVVFKPSEQTPAVGEWMVRAWNAIGLPAGVLNLVQGGREVGIATANPERCDGLLFTGSGGAGRALHRAFADFPQKILALEMGGNNPLIVDQVHDLPAAAYQILLSAYITAGQRCTCARRLILPEEGNSPADLLAVLIGQLTKMRVGLPSDEPEPFYGTVISSVAGRQIVQAYQEWLTRGARVLLPLEPLRGNPALLSPGLLDITDAQPGPDEEIFGPLLTVHRVPSWDDAIAVANDTKYGLSAGLLSDNAERYQDFIQRIRAGIVNWNRQTTGASGKLPFGGCGWSGNSRPAGYYSADYCSYPVASLESTELKLPSQREPGLEGT